MRSQRVIMRAQKSYWTANYTTRSSSTSISWQKAEFRSESTSSNCRAPSSAMINSFERHKPMIGKNPQQGTTTTTTTAKRANANFIPIACQHFAATNNNNNNNENSSYSSSSSQHLDVCWWSPGSNHRSTASGCELTLAARLTTTTTICESITLNLIGRHENCNNTETRQRRLAGSGDGGFAGIVFSRKFSSKSNQISCCCGVDGRFEGLEERRERISGKQGNNNNGQHHHDQPRVTLFECSTSESGGFGADRAVAEENCRQKERVTCAKEDLSQSLSSASNQHKNSRQPLGQAGSGLDPAATTNSRKASNNSSSNENSLDRRTNQSLFLKSRESYERILWRAARDYQQTDHYDHSLFGLDAHMDQAVARHQREAMLYNQDRHLKEEQAKKVAPNQKQSPISIMSLNPTYVLNNKPLIIEYPATVENLRLNNTGFSWEVKLPYQISMTTSLYGAHLNQGHRFRLDQFHCHWGDSNEQGSEHSVDNHFYSAELHFVHYNMEKYHTFSKAARHSDGLVVLSVFIDAHEDHHNHAELEKIVTHLKAIQLKGEHSILRQAVRIENLLPANRSYWSYQGSLTTPPYLESVTWFVLKQPIKCSQVQINKFRNIKSSLRHDEGIFIKSNHRRTQPLNGRTIVMFDETAATANNAGPTTLSSSAGTTPASSRGILRST